MADKKGWGSTVLGWFIVQDEPADTGDTPKAPAVAAAADADAAVIAAAAAAPPIFSREPPAPAPGGEVPFDEVYEAAGVDADERARVAKAQQLLASLPADTPHATKKQIVEASLTAFGVPIESIIEAGVAEVEALEGYIRRNAAETQQLLQETTRRIAQFEEEIRSLRARMEQQVQQQQGIAGACNARKLEVQQVLEFFGQDAVARVVQASPRLHDPSTQPGETGQQAGS